MAFATQNRSGLNALQIEISAGLYGLMTRIADYRAYRRTIKELSRLDARELADLGLSRAEIPDVARATVYGTRG